MESAGIKVYVIEKNYSYEGAEAVWAGVSFDDAMAFADSLGTNCGDDLTITMMNPFARERWERDRYATKYLHTVFADGAWKVATP